MGPTTEFTINANQSGHQDYDGQSSVEDIKAFQHARNMTGVVGDSKWHDDVIVNDLWDKLSVPEANGKKIICVNTKIFFSEDVENLQKSVVFHVINTLARTHFNCDDFAGYQAAAHRYIDALRNLFELFLVSVIV